MNVTPSTTIKAQGNMQVSQENFLIPRYVTSGHLKSRLRNEEMKERKTKLPITVNRRRPYIKKS